jgi:hypothetical protein
LACLVSTIVSAQQAAVIGGGPILGHAFDKASHSILPIRGIPGAATLGEPLEFGFSVQDAVVSSQQGYALVIARDDSSVRLIRWTNGISISEVPVVGTAKALYMSPRGSAAAVATDGWLGFVTGMDAGNPQVMGLALDTQPLAAAVSDDGAYVLAAIQDGTAVLLGRDGTRTQLSALGAISKVAFRPGSLDALAATTDNRVFLIQQIPSSAVFAQVAASADGISDPTGLGFLPDGNRAVIANSGNGTIQMIDVRTGDRSSVSCGCKPVQLEPLAIAGTFRLTEATHEPQYLFDGVSGRTFFVPAAPLKPAGERRPRN